MTVTLNAVAYGSGNSIQDYYITVSSSFLPSVQEYLNANPADGFLLKYSAGGSYYVWDPQKAGADKW